MVIAVTVRGIVSIVMVVVIVEENKKMNRHEEIVKDAEEEYGIQLDENFDSGALCDGSTCSIVSASAGKYWISK